MPTFIKGTWDKILILFEVLCVLLPLSPAFMPLVYRDSGVFLYTGWRILNGQVPYLNVWDHKPPIIFFINSLGLAFANNSRWGVWLIEFISLFFAAYIGFKLLQKALGSFPAIVGTLFWLLTLVFVIEGGNLTEEYALPLQFAALWLFYSTSEPNIKKWKYFLIGLLGCIAFFTKQTSIGIWVAIIIFLTFKAVTSGQIKNWFIEILYISLGVFSVCIPIVLYFGIHGAFTQFINATFEYNFIYASAIKGFKNRLFPITNGIKPLVTTGLFQFSMIGSIIASIIVVFKKEVIQKQITLLTIGLIDLPIEFLLISGSGNAYSHYYISILPILGIFAGFAFWFLLTSLKFWGIKNDILSFLTIGTVLIILWSSFNDYNKQRRAYENNNNTSIINYITSTTSPDDYVLLWGAESSINYYSERISPTRFVYQYPLYMQRYTSEKMILEFMDDVIQNNPKLIIDTKNPSTPMYVFPIKSESIDEKISYLQSNYHFVENINSWSIYEKNATIVP